MRKALLFHPDKLPPTASEEDVERNKVFWLRLVMARDTLHDILNNLNCQSSKCLKRADEIYQNMSYADLMAKMSPRQPNVNDQMEAPQLEFRPDHF